MLGEIGMLTSKEVKDLTDALEGILKSTQKGDFVIEKGIRGYAF